jgi:large subunit ribosomal protein L33
LELDYWDLIVMASKKKPFVKLVCSGCKKINYITHKSKTMEGKLDMVKYCKTERKHTKHKEAKK